MARLLTAAVAVSLGMGSVASGALVEYAYAPGLVYDSTQDITWLKDAGMFPCDPTQGDWWWLNDQVTGFEYVSGGYTYDDWRLPETVAGGPYAKVGEMGNLYVLYGIEKDVYEGPFVNMTGEDYWTGTDAYGDPNYAYYFTFATFFLGQWGTEKSNTSTKWGWPVFDGPPMPEPATLVLLGVGLAALVVKRTR